MLWNGFFYCSSKQLVHLTILNDIAPNEPAVTVAVAVNERLNSQALRVPLPGPKEKLL